MIAKVVTENKEYYSYVFARFNPGYYETLIVFDNGYIYWIDDYIEDVKNISEENIYFRARSLKWKMINKKDNM